MSIFCLHIASIFFSHLRTVSTSSRNSYLRYVLLTDLRIFCILSRIIYAIKGYLNFKSRIIYAIRGYLNFKSRIIYAIRGYFKFMWIFRVYEDISSCHLIEYHILHCKIMTVSRARHQIFHGDFAQTITNIRNVEIYESK